MVLSDVHIRWHYFYQTISCVVKTVTFETKALLNFKTKTSSKIPRQKFQDWDMTIETDIWYFKIVHFAKII